MERDRLGRVISSYRDLNVWSQAMDLAETCYEDTKEFPKEEIYGITAQIRRASVSIPANIAEGHGRENTGSYIQFLRVAQGSLKELETHLILAGRIGYLVEEQVVGLLGRCEAIGKMLRSLIRTLQRKENRT